MPNGEEILHQTLQHATAADFPVLTLLGPGDLTLATRLAKDFPRTEFLRCPESPLGIGHSIAFGMDHMRDLGWRVCLLTHGDMPWVSSRTYNAIGKRITPDKIVVPRYQERVGRPLGYGRHYFAELAELRGDSDDSSVWRHHPDRVEYLELDDRSILQDIDLPEDLLR